MTRAEGATVAHRTRGQRFEHLDMLRGVAALLVLVGHVRGFVLVDHSDLTTHRLLWAPLYMVLGLGHQAVMLFFALSGFLVGGRALHEIARGSWNLPDYAVHRFARLWTALIPALLATALIDWAGRDLLGLAGYRGEFWNILSSGPATGSSVDTSFATFVGNIAFLQTVVVPVFGTNGPLWSLTYEFWYYFVIPFAWLAVAGRGRGAGARIAAGLFALVALVLLPSQIVVMGSIWIAGAAAWLLGERVRALPARHFGVVVAIVSVIAAGGIAASFVAPGLASDLLLGFACATLLPFVARLRNPGGTYGRVAFWISEISFTLYVMHFPLIALLWFWCFAPVQLLPSLVAAAHFAELVVASIVFATAMWWLFERNTPQVRRFLAQTLGLR